MCSDAAPGVEFEEVGCYGNGEGRAFFGVGSRTQFVEENKGVSGSVAGDTVEVDDMGGEAGEVALDRLSVPNVGVDALEDGKLRFFGGDGNTGLRHEREQAECLERDCLAASIWAADDELSCFRRKDDGERHWSLWFFVLR